jgi:hypothetical protein
VLKTHFTSCSEVSHRRPDLSGVVLGCLGGGAGRRCVALGHTAINDKVCTVDEAALVAGQEQNRLSLLDSFTEATSGEVDLAAVTLLSVVTEPVLEERGARKSV